MSVNFEIKTVGVVGLGLIGGSFAKAFKENAGYTVYGYDLNPESVAKAIADGTLDKELTDENIKEVDLLIPALYPRTVISYVKRVAPLLKKGALVVDTAGLKRDICRELFPVAKEYGFTFVGGHPMAGKKFSGYEYSTGKLFQDSSMIVVPENLEDSELLAALEKVFLPCECARLTVCSAEKHDSMIAFTSELAHIVSNAYVKSPTAMEHQGFSAGSYKDLTRVAWLNQDMWTEIFMDNRDNVIKELDYIIKFLGEYKEALQDGDAERMRQLLTDGKIAKETIDGI